MLDHFARLGGMIVHPRATLSRIIVDREGGLLELLPWIALVAIVLEPVRAGQTVLVMRTSVVDGLIMLVSVIANRMSPALAGALAGAVLLYVVERVRRSADQRHGFDAALDASAFCLVPYLMLASIAQSLAVLDADAWWMPNHPLRGRLFDRAVEITVGFGWSLVLFALAWMMFWRTAPPVRGISHVDSRA